MTHGSEARRCSDCPEHSGIVKDLEAGDDCMHRLERSIEKLRDNFNNHVASSLKSTIAMLVGILMCFLTGLIGIYVNHVKQPGVKYVMIQPVTKQPVTKHVMIQPGVEYVVKQPIVKYVVEDYEKGQLCGAACQIRY